MATSHPVQLVFGLTGYAATVGGVNVTRDRVARLDLPQNFSAENLKTMQKDLEILSQAVANSPDDIVALQNAVLANNFHSARDVAHKLGLAEEALVAQGGGYVWLVVAAI